MKASNYFSFTSQFPHVHITEIQMDLNFGGIILTIENDSPEDEMIDIKEYFTLAYGNVLLLQAVFWRFLEVEFLSDSEIFCEATDLIKSHDNLFLSWK